VKTNEYASEWEFRLK